ncbi:hypothetical protein FDQ92_14180 [Desulfoglaeba alkanexedens ALDC]|uniref:Uncharacterized protein n=1 Tax=Desulfoglaeba alkanexedens ALDC TaxID=980445 RepID=A0A4P8L5F6_9BACT|nr:hypothetical protein FDQ92_14180 [Desulfoglaeba alkanexedens ALDC]
MVEEYQGEARAARERFLFFEKAVEAADGVFRDGVHGSGTIHDTGDFSDGFSHGYYPPSRVHRKRRPFASRRRFGFHLLVTAVGWKFSKRAGGIPEKGAFHKRPGKMRNFSHSFL